MVWLSREATMCPSQAWRTWCGPWASSATGALRQGPRGASQRSVKVRGLWPAVGCKSSGPRRHIDVVALWEAFILRISVSTWTPSGCPTDPPPRFRNPMISDDRSTILGGLRAPISGRFWGVLGVRAGLKNADCLARRNGHYADPPHSRPPAAPTPSPDAGWDRTASWVRQPPRGPALVPF